MQAADDRDPPPPPDAPSAPNPDWEEALERRLAVRRREPLRVARKRALVKTLPQVDLKDTDRMQALLSEGLVAAGIRRPRLKVELRPYAGLRASLEQDAAGPIQPGERLTMRLSDGYAQASDDALRGLGASLGIRLTGRRRPPELARLLEEHYVLWENSTPALELQGALRKARAKKQGRGPVGEVYDLAELTGRVVARYIRGKIRPVTVTWSTRASLGTLGHHDGDLDTIVISKALDERHVPESVVAYVLYHEMLHHVMGIGELSDRRRFHPPAFRRREQRFRNWAIADAYLERMAEKGRPIKRREVHPRWHLLWDEAWDGYD